MSVGILSGLLQYFPKNRSILVKKKIGGRKKIVKIRFRLFYENENYEKKEEKNLWPLSPRKGGGLGLNGPAIKRRTFFLRLP